MEKIKISRPNRSSPPTLPAREGPMVPRSNGAFGGAPKPTRARSTLGGTWISLSKGAPMAFVRSPTKAKVRRSYNQPKSNNIKERQKDKQALTQKNTLSGIHFDILFVARTNWRNKIQRLRRWRTIFRLLDKRSFCRPTMALRCNSLASAITTAIGAR